VRALVADDDTDIAAMIAGLLELRGYEPVAVHSASQLLHRLAARDAFDVLIADIGMPWANARHVDARLPIIVTSAWSDTTLSEWVSELRLGVTLLRKPFDSGALFAAIARARRRG
jgi:DNA-binding response OmpR family regulator